MDGDGDPGSVGEFMVVGFKRVRGLFSNKHYVWLHDHTAHVHTPRSRKLFSGNITSLLQFLKYVVFFSRECRSEVTRRVSPGEIVNTRDGFTLRCGTRRDNTRVRLSYSICKVVK